MLLLGDRLSDGATIAAVHQTAGQVYADLDDGRQLVLPPNYMLQVYRPDKEPQRPRTGDLPS